VREAASPYETLFPPSRGFAGQDRDGRKRRAERESGEMDPLAPFTHPELGAAELVHSDRLIFHTDTFKIRRRAAASSRVKLKPIAAPRYRTVPDDPTAPRTRHRDLPSGKATDPFLALGIAPSPSRTTLRHARRGSRDRHATDGGGARQHPTTSDTHESFEPCPSPPSSPLRSCLPKGGRSAVRRRPSSSPVVTRGHAVVRRARARPPSESIPDTPIHHHRPHHRPSAYRRPRSERPIAAESADRAGKSLARRDARVPRLRSRRSALRVDPVTLTVGVFPREISRDVKITGPRSARCAVSVFLFLSSESRIKREVSPGNTGSKIGT